MTRHELAMSYIEAFCNSDIDQLSQLLADDFSFNGPRHAFNSAQEYIDCLRGDPPEPSNYEIISVTENEHSVAVFYTYLKPLKSMKLAQLFGISDGLISNITLVFDAT